MIGLKEYFSIYIDLLMLAIGLYMTFVQSTNLVKNESLERESRFCRVVGWIYIVLGAFGLIVQIFG